jgi:hypothetical protein
MRNLKTLKSLFILCLVICFLSSCSTGTKLEQEVSVRRICENTYYVSTYVKVYGWDGMIESLEYWEQTIVKEDKIDSVKIVEYNKALPTFEKVKECNCR